MSSEMNDLMSEFKPEYDRIDDQNKDDWKDYLKGNLRGIYGQADRKG